MKQMEFEELGEFKRDLKKLLKRYPSLASDLEIIRKVLKVNPEARPPFSFVIDGLGIKSCVIKVKKIACRSLKGRGVNTGLRLVYAHFENAAPGENHKIVFIEIYHKNDKANEERERILKHFS